MVQTKLSSAGAAVQQPIEAVFVNLADVLTFNIVREPGRVSYQGTLENGGSFTVSYQDAKVNIQVNASTSIVDSNQNAGEAMLMIRRLPLKEAPAQH